MSYGAFWSYSPPTSPPDTCILLQSIFIYCLSSEISVWNSQVTAFKAGDPRYGKGMWLHSILFSFLWPHAWAVKGAKVRLYSGLRAQPGGEDSVAGSRPQQLEEVCLQLGGTAGVAMMLFSVHFSTPKSSDGAPNTQGEPLSLPQLTLSGNTLRDRCRGVSWVILNLVKWAVVIDPSCDRSKFMSWTSMGSSQALWLTLFPERMTHSLSNKNCDHSKRCSMGPLGPDVCASFARSLAPP